MIVIGIDPDSNRHGVAVYENGKLTGLYNWTLMQLMAFVEIQRSDELLISIEDVCANNAMFHDAKSKSAQASIGRRIGMVQQSQKEIERMCEWFEIPVVKNKISSNWKSQSGKKQFEKITIWTGRSNEDTRSAAYFGWLHAKEIN